MQLCKSWRGLISIVGLCLFTGFLVELQDLPHHSIPPVFEWLDTESTSVPAKALKVTVRSRETDEAMESPPTNIKDKVRIDI